MPSLVSSLRRHAGHTPAAACITHLASGKLLSYAELFETAQRLATVLEKHGVGKKDRVALVIRNHWLVFPLLVACSARRATLVPIDPELHRDQLAFIVADAAPSLIIHLDGAVLPKPSGKSTQLSLTELSAALKLATAPGKLAESAPSEVVLMIYTSGTTGSSKCVMLTEGNLVANAMALVTRYRIAASDRFFCMMPTHHMNALMITGLVPLLAGAHIYLSDVVSFKNAKLYWKQLAKLGVTVCSLVPSVMALQLKLFPAGPNAALTTLRFGFCGAAPLSAALWKRFEDVFSIRVYQGYGLTETTCWAASTPLEEVPRRYDSVGVPLDGIEIRIVPADLGDGNALVFDADAQGGEVWIKGPIVGPGYYKDAKLTRESLTAEGFFRTGDLGFFDTGGQLHISGRLKEVIIKNGTNVFPNDIDRVLCEHPAIEAAKTIGVRDELVGERIYATFVVRESHTVSEQELRAFVQKRLSQSMWPDALFPLGYLPVNAAGKISTNVLRKIVTGELCDEILGSLGTSKLKCASPSEPEKLRAIIQDALMRGRPISFLCYWGAGRRGCIGEVDRVSLDRLNAYLDGARRVPRAAPEVTVLFTDAHARDHRIPEVRMQRYWSEVETYAHALGMRTARLSDLWREARLLPAQIDAATRTPEFEAIWQTHPLRSRLIEQAQEHVEQRADAEQAARYHLAACACEGAAIVARYPSSIFLTYDPPEFDCVSPPMPKLYLHAFEADASIKPWLIDDAAAAAAGVHPADQ